MSVSLFYRNQIPLHALQSQIVKGYPHWFGGDDNSDKLDKALTLVRQIHSDARYRSGVKGSGVKACDFMVKLVPIADKNFPDYRGKKIGCQMAKKEKSMIL